MALQKTPLTYSPPPSAPKPPVMKKPAAPQTANASSSAPFWIGLAISVVWVLSVLAIIAKAGPSHALAGVALADWAIGISAIVSPVAMVWMVTAYLQRAADIQSIADPLRRQLTLITGESGAADARIRRFNQAIREQVELLRSAQTMSSEDLEEMMERVRQHRSELERFENVSAQQVKEIQDVVRRSMYQVEQMMDDKFTMLRVLEGKLQQNSDGVARQVESVGEQIGHILESVESTSLHLAEALERAQRDSQKLADTSHLQGSSLTHAAEAACETLGSLSSKIDLSVARFLERASTAREEAERLAQTLDAQTRALDDFSTTLPVRVGEAESVLRGVADRLYSSEQLAREQALHLSDQLSQQVDGLQSFMDRFTGRLSDIDSGLDLRHSELSTLSDRIGSTTSTFLSSWEKSLTDLNDRTGNSLLRFTVINDETRRNAESVATHLEETTGKYEDVVVRMHKLSFESGTHMQGMTEEIARHLTQFEALSLASNKAGEEVQQRASSALEKLQHVLERVLAAREATQTVGETLVKDINDAVTQNEKMIEHLNETVQLGARAIGAASETLGRHQNELAEKARASENVLLESVQKLQQQAETTGEGLREQTVSLKNLLAETQSQLIITDQKLQSFATHAVVPVQKAVEQIDERADQSLRTLGSFGQELSVQVARIQDFNSRIGTMSQEMGQTTAESASTFEALNERFAAVRRAQQESVQQTLSQFSDLSERIHSEITGLDGKAATAVELLQQATVKVGEQSYHMLEKAQSAGTQVKDVATALQAEAAQIQTILHRQTEEINNDLAHVEQKFTALGETIRERADAAHTLLNRTAAHYNDVTQQIEETGGRLQKVVTDASQGAEQVAVRFLDMTEGASTRIGGAARELHTMAENVESSLAALGVHITQQSASLSVVDDQINEQQRTLAAAKEQQQAQLVGLLNRLSLAQDEAAASAERAISRLAEGTQKIIQNVDTIDSRTKNALTSVQTASAGFAFEAEAIDKQAKHAEQQARSILTSASGMHEQISGLRNSMREEGDLTNTVLSTLLEKVTTGATQIRDLSASTEVSLMSLGNNVTQQSTALNAVMQQIGERQSSLGSALDKQRDVISDLLHRLSLAQEETVASADRTTTRLSQDAQQISQQVESLDKSAKSALISVNQATEIFTKEAQAIDSEAKRAEQQAQAILASTSALHSQIYDLRTSMQYDGERSDEVLTNLLSRITSGGGEIHDVSATIEKTLTALQRAVSTQTTEIGNSLHDMSERQQLLTKALESQRDVIHGLLNRFTLAYDETAALTERTASRINDGAQQITDSINLMGAQASTTLNSVQASVSGFAEQSSVLNQESQKAEQTARVIEQLTTIISQLDVSGQKLEDGIELIHKQSEALASTVEQSEQRMSIASEKMHGHLRLVGEIGDKTEAQAQQVANAAEFATTRLVSLREAFNSNDEESADMVARASQRIEEVKVTLQNQLQQLSDFSHQVVDKLTTAMQTLASQSDTLRSNLAASESAVSEAADMVREESKHLPAALNRSLSTIEAATQTLKGQSTEADQALVGTADRFISVTASARNNMAEEMQRVSTVADEAGKILNGFNQLLNEQVASMQRSTALLSSEQKDMVEKASLGIDSLAGASNHLATLRGEASATVERLLREFDLLDQRANVTGGRLIQAGAGIAKQVDAITEATSRAENQISHVSEGLHEQLARIGGGLQSQINDINRGLIQITAQLERTGANLRSTTVGAVADVERVGQRFEQTNTAAAAQLDACNEKMRMATEEVAQHLNNFSTQFDTTLRHMATAGEDIRSQEGNALTHLQGMLAHLSTVAEKLESTRSLSGDISQHAIERLDEVVTAVQAQMNNMAAGAQTAAGIMRGINQIYNDQTTALSRGVGEAHNQVMSMNKSIDDMQQRTDHMRMALQLQGEDLMTSLRQILSQLEASGDGLSDAVSRALQNQETMKKIS